MGVAAKPAANLQRPHPGRVMEPMEPESSRMHPTFTRGPDGEGLSEMHRPPKTLALITAVGGALSLLVTLAGAASAAALMPRGRPAAAPPVGNWITYATHAQVVSANGTTGSHMACPAGALPVGGGVAVQSPGIEHVIQAGFAASAATGRLDGYQAVVQVSGLPRRAKVRFTVQVACIPAARIFVVYVIRTEHLSANGTTWWAVPCPAGTLPAGGGAVAQAPRIERVTQAGFHATAPAGRADG
jgi:hypothetical protein